MPLFSGPRLASSAVAPLVIADSTTETVVSRLTVPGGVAHVGSTWFGMTTGVLSTPATGSPQIMANVRVGGLTGTSVASIAIPATTVQTNVSFWIGFTVACVTTGSSGTWTGNVFDIDVLSGPNANVQAPASAVTQDTTISNDIVLTLAWSAAILGNTLTVTSSSLFPVV